MPIYEYPDCTPCCGTGAGGVVVECCPNALPETLNVSFFDGSLNLLGTAVITWDAVNQWWQGSGTYDAAPFCTGQDFVVRLQCVESSWHVKACFISPPFCDIDSGGCSFMEGGSPNGIVENSCNPLDLTVDGQCPTCYSGGAVVQLRITE